MALTIPAGTGIAALAFTLTGDPEPMYCTFGVQPVAGPMSTAHAQRIAAAWQTQGLTKQSNETKLLGCTIRTRQDGGGDTVETYLFATPPAGGMADSAMPPNVAVVAEKRTALAGRRNTGRMFVPGVPSGDDDSAGRLAASRITGWNTVLAAFLSALGAAASGTGPTAQAPVTMVLLHGNLTTTTRIRSGDTTTVTTVRGAAGALPTPVTSLTVDPIVGTQRRRLR